MDGNMKTHQQPDQNVKNLFSHKKHSSDASVVSIGTGEPDALVAAIKNSTFLFVPHSVLPPSSDASGDNSEF
jgi:hypothetical protein